MKMNKSKPKSIIIGRETHEDFKIFCKGKNLKIGGVVENLIQVYMSKTIEVRKLMDVVKMGV